MNRICALCREEKPLEKFHNSKGNKYDKSYYCASCACKQTLEWNKNNQGKLKITRQNTRKMHKERFEKFGPRTEPKKCPGCKIIKPYTDFALSSNNGDGLIGRCRPCSAYRIAVRHDQEKNRKTCTLEEYTKAVSNPCHYCGFTEFISADRADNSRGHEADNIIPCCHECNAARMDHFTVEEMKLEIGPAIARIRQKRKEAN